MLKWLFLMLVGLLPLLAGLGEGALATFGGLALLYAVAGCQGVTSLLGRGGVIVSKSFFLPLLLLLAITGYGVVVASLNGFSLASSIYSGVRILTMFVIFQVASSLSSARHGFGASTLWVIVVFCALFAFLGSVDRLIGGDAVSEGRYRGVATSVNNLAMYSSVGLCVAYYLWSAGAGKTGRKFAILLGAICIGGVLAAGSLGPVLGLCGALLYIYRHKAKGTSTLIALGGFVVTMLLIYTFSSQIEIVARLYAILGDNLLLKYYEAPSNSWQWRVVHWQLLIARWTSEYLLFGAGLGQQVFISDFRTMEDMGYSAHNEYIGFLIEFGLIGTSLILWTLVWLCMRAIYWAGVRPVQGSFAIAILVLLAIAAMVAPILSTGAVQYYVPALFGVFWGNVSSSRLRSRM